MLEGLHTPGGGGGGGGGAAAAFFSVPANFVVLHAMASKQVVTMSVERIFIRFRDNLSNSLNIIRSFELNDNKRLTPPLFHREKRHGFETYVRSYGQNTRKTFVIWRVFRHADCKSCSWDG